MCLSIPLKLNQELHVKDGTKQFRLIEILRKRKRKAERFKMFNEDEFATWTVRNRETT